jgi:uncharacterized protein (DUF488 family)
VWSIGHSTRPLDELVGLLRAHGVARVVDVRRFPRSRRHPQFDTAALARDLPAAGVAYAHAPGLGGFRRARPDSRNTGLHNTSFRGYADYMQTGEFAHQLAALIATAAETPTAIMCAEAVPWRCHRRLITDALLARGLPVADITGPGAATPARLSEHALVRPDGSIIYPAAPGVQEELFTP